MGALTAPFTRTSGGYMIVRSGGVGSERQDGMRPPWKHAQVSRAAHLRKRHDRRPKIGGAKIEVHTEHAHLVSKYGEIEPSER